MRRYVIDANDSSQAILPWHPINERLAMLLVQLISARDEEHNSSDEKLNKHLDTLQHDSFIANPNKSNVAKYTHHTTI